MKKFAAHYVLTDHGELLKNGMAMVAPDGTIILVDTKGNLTEIERLIFHSGFLFKGFEYVRNSSATSSLPDEMNPPILLPATIAQSDHVSLSQVVDWGMQLQVEHPRKTVPALFHLIDQALLRDHQYRKTPVSGLYLLSSLDLSTLRFKPTTRLKKII